MSDEEYIIRREVYEEEDGEEIPNLGSGNSEQNGSVFDNEFRILVLANSSMSTENESQDGTESTGINVEESDMEELLLRQVKTIDDVNEFFDEFDSKIAEPNEGHLKYEVGSDGLCVVLVDSIKLKDTVVTFVQRFIENHPFNDNDNSKQITGNNDEEGSAKKRRK